MHPGVLAHTGEYESKDEDRVRLKGEIIVDPVAVNRAITTMRRVQSGDEYIVQEYFLMANGDIFVVPQGGGCNNHVLRKPDRRPRHCNCIESAIDVL